MNWKATKENDMRWVKRFPLLPRRIKGRVYWLEVICIQQCYLGAGMWQDVRVVK